MEQKWWNILLLIGIIIAATLSTINAILGPGWL